MPDNWKFLTGLLVAVTGLISGIVGWYTKARGATKEDFESVVKGFQRLEESATKRLNTLEKENKSLRLRFDKLQKRYDELQSKHIKLYKYARSAKRSYEAQIKQLKERLATLEKHNYILIHEHVRKLLWDNPAIGWAFVSDKGIIIEANKALHEMLGYEEEELHGVHFVTITADDDAKPDMENFTKLLSGEIQHYKMIKKYVRKDGGTWEARLDVFHIEGENFVLGRVARIADS
jgi:PAS domain S-box-containing protein